MTAICDGNNSVEDLLIAKVYSDFHIDQNCQNLIFSLQKQMAPFEQKLSKSVLF